MRASILPALDASMLVRLDQEILDEQRFVIPRPARLYRSAELFIRAWMHKRARYQLVTSELVDWLKEQIGGRRALEVAAGMGDIGRAVGIPMTDSYLQVQPEVRAHYERLNQPAISPPAIVEKFDANEAVRALKPQVVVASWLTQKFLSGDEKHPPVNSSVYGTDEVEIADSVEMFIHIGNESSHDDKRALRRPHRVFKPDWLVSRSANQNENVIYIWGK